MTRVKVASQFCGRFARISRAGRPVKFWPVYSYLIVYDPETKPVQVIRVLHGMRDVEEILN